MWKVGDIKIERTQALNFFFCFLQTDNKISENGDLYMEGGTKSL